MYLFGVRKRPHLPCLLDPFNEDYDWILLFENYDMISASESFWTGLVHYAGGPWLSQCHRTCFAGKSSISFDDFPEIKPSAMF